MTTTSTWLRTLDRARLAFVVVFDGLPDVWTTTADTAGIKTAWAGTDWASTTWRSGMQIFGEMRQEVEIFNPKIKPDSVRVEIVDPDDAFAGIFFKSASATADTTYLEATLDNNDTTATVLDTSQFAETGTVYIGNETITYSGTTATTFTGLSRGQYALYQTSGGGDFAQQHAVAQSGLKPIVSSEPRSHYNRGVQIWLHHKEQGAWSTKANARLVWSGRIKAISDEGDRRFVVDATSLLEAVEKCTLLEEQFGAQIKEGIYLPQRDALITVLELDVALTVANNPSALLTTYDAQRTSAQVVTDIGTAFDAWDDATETAWDWGIDYVDGKVRIRCVVGTDDPRTVAFAAPAAVMRLLGFASTEQGTVEVDETTYHVISVFLHQVEDSTRWEVVAENLPTKYLFSTYRNGAIEVEGASGTWNNQPAIGTVYGGPGVPPVSVPSSTEGFLEVEGLAVFAVSYTDLGDGAARFTVKLDVTKQFAGYGFDGAGLPPIAALVREGEADRLKVRQVWLERDNVGEVMARLLLSTGTSTYNHATYDVNPVGMGAAIPASVIDEDSIEGIGDTIFTLLINKPTKLTDVIESALALKGWYLVFREGQITARALPIASSAPASAHVLGENSKADPRDRTRYEYASDGIINSATIEYHRQIDGSFGKSAEITDERSRSDFDQRRGIKIKAWGLFDEGVDDAIITVSQALALFSRPLVTAERTVSQRFLHIAPCDSALLTDNYVIDPTTGTRGITSLPCAVVGTSFDFQRMAGKVRLIFLPEIDFSRIVPWAPAARVDETHTAGDFVNGIDTTNSKLKLKANHYSTSDEDEDITYFASGYLVRCVPVSDTGADSASIVLAEITDVDSVNRVLTLSIASGTFDTARDYYVEYQAISAVTTDQKGYTFIASSTDDSTGASAGDAYKWGSYPPSVSAPVPVYDTPFIQNRSTVDDTGRPLTVADWDHLVTSLNNLLSHKTRTCVWSSPLVPVATNATTTYTKVIGPVPVPIFGPGRAFVWRALFKTSSGTAPAQVRVTFSQEAPTGSTETAPTFGGQVAQGDVSTTSPTNVWSDWQSLTPVANTGAPSWCYMTAELRISAGTGTAALAQIVVYEDEIQ